MTIWIEKAGPDQRWVCGACGRVGALGAARDLLRDTSCVMWAVLCHAERDRDGKWQPVTAAEAAAAAEPTL